MVGIALLGALLGGVAVLFTLSDFYGLFHLPRWSGMTMGDKMLLIGVPCAGALLGCILSTLSTEFQQASTSQTQPPESSSIGTTHSCFRGLMSKLTSEVPEVPECRPTADIDLEAQTHQQFDPSTSSKVPMDLPSSNLSASSLDTDISRAPPPSYTSDNRGTISGLDTDIPRAPPPSYTPDHRATNV